MPLTPTRFTHDQLTRLHAIVDAWNAIRRDDRKRATAHEVIDYLLTQEEIGIEGMAEAEATEEREERQALWQLAEAVPSVVQVRPAGCICGEKPDAACPLWRSRITAVPPWPLTSPGLSAGVLRP